MPFTTQFEPISYTSTKFGEYFRYKFPNGFGASVISSHFSIGGHLGLWEIAVLDQSGKITYETPITDCTIGNLRKDEVEKILVDISNLSVNRID